MKIAAIDPGCAFLAYATPSRLLSGAVVDPGKIYSLRIRPIPPAELGRRAFEAAVAVRRWIDCHRDRIPDLVAIEGYAYGTGKKTLVRVAEVNGAILAELHAAGVDSVVWIPPASVKLFSTGSGIAAKEEMIGRAVELGLGAQNEHEADAGLLRTMAEAAYGLRDTTEAYELEAIAGVSWPGLT